MRPGYLTRLNGASAAMSISESLGLSPASRVMTMTNKLARPKYSGDGQDKERLRATATTHHTLDPRCLALSDSSSDLERCAA